MLELESLTLEHFMCIDNAELDLTSMITILEGDNGQGKSAVMEAIAICLAERKRADSVKEFVQKGYEHSKIVLKMKYNTAPIVFNVTLNVRGGTPLERDVEYENKHYINSEVTDLIKDLDLSFYSDIILSMQGQDDIATMTPVQRANLLQKLFQFDFAEKVKSISDKIDEANEAIKLDNSKIEYLTKELTAKEARRNSVVLKEPPCSSEEYWKLQDAEDELFEKLTEVKNAMSEVLKLQEEGHEYGGRASALEFKIRELNNKKAEAKKAKNEVENFGLEKKCQAFSDAIDLATKKVGELTVQIEQLSSQETQMYQLAQAASNNHSTCIYKRGEFEKKKSLIASGVCPECGQSTCNMDHSSIEADAENNEEAIVFFKKTVDDCNASISLIKTQITDLRNQVLQQNSSITLNNTQMDTIKMQYSNLQSKIMPLEEYEKLESDITIAQADMEALTAKKKSIDEQLESKKDIWQQQNLIETAYNTVKTKIKAFDDVRVFNDAAQKQIENYDEDIKNSELNIEEIKNDVASLSRDIDCYNEVKKVLDKELPNFLIIKTCSKLENEMNTFVQDVFPEFRIRLLQSKRGVEFFYTTDPNNDMEDTKTLINSKMASGYEKSVLGISFKVALCRAYGLTFAALDEIDAAASDGNSMKTFQSLINSNVFEQMIFITHKESTRESIKQMSEDVTSYHVEAGVFTNEAIED